MGGDKQVFKNAQLTDDFNVLESAHNALGDDVMHLIVVEQQHISLVGAVDDVALRGLVKLRDAVEYCGFSRTVGANEAEDLAFLHIKAQVIHSPQPAKYHGYTIKAQADILGQVILSAKRALVQAILLPSELIAKDLVARFLLFGKCGHMCSIFLGKLCFKGFDLTCFITLCSFKGSHAACLRGFVQPAFLGLFEEALGEVFTLLVMFRLQLIELFLGSGG